MNSFSNWSNDSQTHTQICILESQIGVKDREISNLKEKNDTLELKHMELKDERDRLQELVRTLSVGKSQESVDGSDSYPNNLLDRFK